MRNMIIASALLGVIGLNATPALSDCIYDIQTARKVVISMSAGRIKEMAERELYLAMLARMAGDEEAYLVHVAVRVQHTKK